MSTMSPEMTGLYNEAVRAVRRHAKGELTREEVAPILEAYRQGIRAAGLRLGRKLRLPSDAYLLRALA